MITHDLKQLIRAFHRNLYPGKFCYVDMNSIFVKESTKNIVLPDGGDACRFLSLAIARIDILKLFRSVIMGNQGMEVLFKLD